MSFSIVSLKDIQLLVEAKNASREGAYIELLLVTQGYALRQCSFNEVRINPSDIHVSISASPSGIAELSPDAEGWYCCLTADFLTSVPAHTHLLAEVEQISSFLYRYPLRLHPAVYERVEALLRSVAGLYSPRPRYRLIYVYLLTLIFELKEVIQESCLDFFPSKAFTIAKQYHDLLLTHITQEQTVEYYARCLKISPNHLNKSVRAVAGRTAIQLLNEVRLEGARRLLNDSSLTIAEVAYRLGFDDPSYFSRFFRQRTGQTPKQFIGID